MSCCPTCNQLSLSLDALLRGERVANITPDLIDTEQKTHTIENWTGKPRPGQGG